MQTYKPSQNFENYVLPSTEYLTPQSSQFELTDAELLATAQEITDKLQEFNVTGRVMHISQGPVISTYEYKLDPGIKFSRIAGLEDDLCLALKVESLRIDRIPGKAFVGIEIPNRQRETIYIREVIESKKFHESNSLLTIALGKTVDGLNYVADLAKMPHLLIAGATGTGKSVAVNSIIVSILYKAKPDEVKFIMVDQKRVELGLYADIPHLATPIINDSNRASVALKWAVSEMEKRYKDLVGWGVRDINSFNTEVRKRNLAEQLDENGEPWRTLPLIVIVIDEFADLMMTSGKETEESIIRLAQMARAVGIHLILATQKPSSEVITGLIKANFSSRIAFRVPARIDSRTILDTKGAENLLGRGDMLFSPPDTADLVRVHGAFVDEREIARIVEHIKAQGTPEYQTTVAQSEEVIFDTTDLPGKQDPLFDEALRAVVSAKRASTSLLQRHLRIGYGRAAAILDAMVREGYVGEIDGSTRSRPVLQKAFDNFQENTLENHQDNRIKLKSKSSNQEQQSIFDKRIDFKTISRILVTVGVISFVVSLGSCVGCYASSESPYSQYDQKYGNPEEQLFFASVMGLTFLISIITSVTALFCSIADEPKAQKVDSGTRVKMRKLFKIFAITAIFSSVISFGSCVGFIATRPSAKDYNYQSRERAKETGMVFGYITGISLLIFFITLVIAFRNYDSSQRKK
jgi:DNA segregation ATPase FtsK/SpoIIIE-like protein